MNFETPVMVLTFFYLFTMNIVKFLTPDITFDAFLPIGLAYASASIVLCFLVAYFVLALVLGCSSYQSGFWAAPALSVVLPCFLNPVLLYSYHWLLNWSDWVTWILMVLFYVIVPLLFHLHYLIRDALL